jgi:hypothetical protein
MLQQLMELEDRFQPHLLKAYYTFIGPADQNLFKVFMQRANDIAPVVSFSRSIHHVLSDKTATRQAAASLPQGTPLRLFVIQRTSGAYEDMLLQDSLEGYCQKNNIDFQP